MVKTKLLKAKQDRLDLVIKRHDYSNVMAMFFINKQDPEAINKGN